jgi:hypothetical protein
MKTFIVKKLRKKRQEQIICRESYVNTAKVEKIVWEVHEENPGPLIVPEEEKKPGKWREKLRILLLALKCADDIDDAFISRIASRLGTHSAIIFHLVEILRTTMQNRTRRVQHLKEKQRNGYFRVHVLLDMRKHCLDKFRASELDKKIRKEKQRLESIHRILSTTPKGPSHTDIARILGLPKGTIDSGFFYLRGKFKKTARKQESRP